MHDVTPFEVSMYTSFLWLFARDKRNRKAGLFRPVMDHGKPGVFLQPVEHMPGAESGRQVGREILERKNASVADPDHQAVEWFPAGQFQVMFQQVPIGIRIDAAGPGIDRFGQQPSGLPGRFDARAHDRVCQSEDVSCADKFDPVFQKRNRVAPVVGGDRDFPSLERECAGRESVAILTGHLEKRVGIPFFQAAAVDSAADTDVDMSSLSQKNPGVSPNAAVEHDQVTIREIAGVNFTIETE